MSSPTPLPRENTFELEGSIPGLPNPPAPTAAKDPLRASRATSEGATADPEKRKLKAKDPAVLVNVSMRSSSNFVYGASSFGTGAERTAEWGRTAAFEGREWMPFGYAENEVVRSPLFALARDLSGYGWEVVEGPVRIPSTPVALEFETASHNVTRTGSFQPKFEDADETSTPKEPESQPVDAKQVSDKLSAVGTV